MHQYLVANIMVANLSRARDTRRSHRRPLRRRQRG